MPGPLSKLLHTKYVFFGGIAGFFYMLHFVCCLCACNFYSDATRLLPCYNPETGEEIVGEAASRILDVGIKLGGIYHILSWVKCTILLVNILVGVNLLTIWYASYLEIPFFLGTFIYIHIVYFSAEGRECQRHQSNRYEWLMFEIVYFWVFGLLNLVPQAFIFLYRRDHLNEVLDEIAKEEAEGEGEY